MNFVIPMAGAGSRFLKAGYTIPKYLIKVKGKTLLEYSIESLPLEIAHKIIFIALEKDINEFGLNDKISKIIGSKGFTILELKKITRGQAETVLFASETINTKNDLLIFNIDTYFRSKTLKDILSSERKNDGVLGYFYDNNPKWSFALTDKNDFVIETTEKIPISENALTGLYHFSQGSDFVRVAKYYINNDIREQNEFYIAPMYNKLIKEGKKFILDYADDFIPLGTPEDVTNFEKKSL